MARGESKNTEASTRSEGKPSRPSGTCDAAASAGKPIAAMISFRDDVPARRLDATACDDVHTNLVSSAELLRECLRVAIHLSFARTVGNQWATAWQITTGSIESFAFPLHLNR